MKHQLRTMGSRLVVGLWILVPATEVRILSSQPIFANASIFAKATLYRAVGTASLRYFVTSFV